MGGADGWCRWVVMGERGIDVQPSGERSRWMVMGGAGIDVRPSRVVREAMVMGAEREWVCDTNIVVFVQTSLFIKPYLGTHQVTSKVGSDERVNISQNESETGTLYLYSCSLFSRLFIPMKRCPVRFKAYTDGTQLNSVCFVFSELRFSLRALHTACSGACRARNTAVAHERLADAPNGAAPLRRFEDVVTFVANW
eukprot:6422921-Prymnesium_polylepis.1